MDEDAVISAEDSSPAFQRVYEAICRRVDRGEYQPGQRLPTERQLGEEFGVSRMTVAKAMAHLTAQKRVTRHRGRGTFVADTRFETGQDTGAKGSRGGEGPAMRCVTFISPGREGEAVVVRRGVLEGLHQVLDAHGCYVGVDFYANVAHHLETLDKQGRQADGLAIWPEPHEQTVSHLRQMLNQQVPLVLVDTYLPELDCDYVVTDNAAGAEMMVHRLASLGHRRIVYLTESPDRSSVRDRLTGYLRGLVTSGAALSAQSVVQVASASKADVAAALAPVLDSGTPPTAIFAAHDYIAMSAYRALRDRGLQVPADVSLVGYDDVDAAGHFETPLTTVRQDYYEMGRIAGHILLERLEGRSAEVRYQRRIRPKLVIRESAASAPPLLQGHG